MRRASVVAVVGAVSAAIAIVSGGAPTPQTLTAATILDAGVTDAAGVTDGNIVTIDAPSPLTLAVNAGFDQRISTPNGAIHVWAPAGYHGDGAAAIVYVHGYYTDVDSAWRDYQLPEQFAASSINALFIAVEAPSGSHDRVRFPELGEVLRLVIANTGMPRPSGPLVAIGHSGAFRTLSSWIQDPPLDIVIMLDAMYGDMPEFARWLAEGPHRRMISVGEDTIRWTEDLAREIPGTVTVDRFPDVPERWPDNAYSAKHLYVRSQYSHMTQVTGDVVLPLLLRLLPVEVLPNAPWDAPLGTLPALPPDAGVPVAPSHHGHRR